MAQVIIQAEQQTPPVSWGGSTCTLRIYASVPFYASDGTYINAGRVGTDNWCQSYDCTIDNDGFITIPEVTLESTSDATPPNSTYTAIFFDSSGTQQTPKLSNFFVSPDFLGSYLVSNIAVSGAGTSDANGTYTHRGTFNTRPYWNLYGQADSTNNYAIKWTGSEWDMTGVGAVLLYELLTDAEYPWDSPWTIGTGLSPAPAVAESTVLVAATWEALTISNQQVPINFFNQTLTTQEILQLFANYAGTDVPFASEIRAGKNYLTKDPVLSTHPIAVASNDDVWLDVNETKYLGSYNNDLDDAIADIGSDNATLVFADTINVTTNTIVPENIRLLQQGNGVFNISGGTTLTIENGLGFRAPADKQIFSGSGVVKWNTTYPPVFYFEWYGAVGDGVTDDLAAILACFVSMQLVTSISITAYVGATVQLGAGKFYACSDTLNIRVPVNLVGYPAVAFFPSCGFQFPANKPGIILQGSSTFNGTPSATNNALGAKLDGFNIRGTTSANNTILSINNLTATLTGGSIQLVSAAGNAGGTAGTVVTPGSTITVHGYNYVVANTLSQNTGTTSIPLLAPRIYVSGDGTTTVTRADQCSWPTANDWVGSTINIAGTVYTINSMTTSALVLNTTVPAGNYTGTVSGSASKVGVASRINIYHGLDIRAYNTELHNVRVQYFSGNGIDCNSNRYPSSAIGTEPNNNNTAMKRVHIEFCIGSGLNLWGVNSNNHDNESLDIQNCAGYGICESATLGCNYWSMHNAFNHQGAFRLMGESAENQMIACYTEGGQPSALIGQNTQVIGGNMGAGFDYQFGNSAMIGTSQGAIRTPAPFFAGRDAGAYSNYVSTVGFALQLGNLTQQNIFEAFGMGSEPCNTGGGFTAAEARILAYQLSYGNLAAGWYGWSYGGNASSDATTQTVLAMSGNAATEGAFKLWFPLGFYAGLSGTKRRINYVSAKPVTGTAALGDIYWNIVANTASTIAWICTTAGNLSTTGVVTPFGASNLEAVSGTAGTLAQFAAGATGGLKLANATETGTGSVVRATSPSLVTPALGVASATSLNVGSGAITGGVVTATSIVVNGGTAITKILKGTVTIDPASIGATTVVTQTFTLTGAVVADTLILNAPTAGIDAGVLISQSWVSAANTISITFFNTTGGAIDIASATWFYTLIRA